MFLQCVHNLGPNAKLPLVGRFYSKKQKFNNFILLMCSEGTAADNLAAAFALVEHNHNRRILTVAYLVQSPTHEWQLVIENPRQLN